MCISAASNHFTKTKASFRIDYLRTNLLIISSLGRSTINMKLVFVLSVLALLCITTMDCHNIQPKRFARLSLPIGKFIWNLAIMGRAECEIIIFWRIAHSYQHCCLFPFPSDILVINRLSHYNDIIMGSMASRITSLTIVYSAVYSGADQRKHQSFASLAFVRGINRGPVNFRHNWPVTRKCFHLMTSSCFVIFPWF